jgi:hypothetical protein
VQLERPPRGRYAGHRAGEHDRRSQERDLAVNSAIADFQCAFGSMVAVEGIISDELADAQLGAAAWPYDRRDANTQTNGRTAPTCATNNQTPGIYNPLSTARWDADHALDNLNNKWTMSEVPNRQELIAKAALYAGFSYAALGMSMCEAAFDLGPQVDQAGMFALAEERFTTAITTGQATNQPDIVNAAYVGRARVRLFQGNKTGAADGRGARARRVRPERVERCLGQPAVQPHLRRHAAVRVLYRGRALAQPQDGEG